MTAELLALAFAFLAGGLAYAWWTRDDGSREPWLYRLEALLHSRDAWAARALTAEQRVQELWLEHCEDRAKQGLSWEIISERTKAIDDAKRKCGPDFKHVVGTERDPVFLSRPNATHDDVAWVATVAEFTKERE